MSEKKQRQTTPMFRIFRHYIPKTLLLLGSAETLITLISVYLGISVRFFDWNSYNVQYSSFYGLLPPTAVIFSLIMLSVMTALGLYERDLRDRPIAILVRLGLSFMLGLMLMTLIFYIYPDLFIGRGAFGLGLVFAFIGIVSFRFFCLQWTDSLLKHRVLVLGAGEKAQFIAQLRRKTDHRGVSIIGFVDIGNGPKRVDKSKLIKLDSSLPEFVERYHIDEIVIALDERRNNVSPYTILECKMKGVQIIDVLTFYERQLGKIKLDSLYPSNLVFSDGFSHAILKSTSKRLFDIIVSAAVLLLALPIMAVVAIATFLESNGKGPIIYRQERAGKSGKTFELLKFRSMRMDAEKDKIARWAQSNDSRVTRIGAFIRKTRLDELPQLINVLKGDMSFVGPRPERPQFVKELSAVIPYYALRHHIKPGITGWAQIRYPYGASINDAKEKLQYDLYYLINYSLFLDLTILIQTIQVILWRKGAR